MLPIPQNTEYRARGCILGHKRLLLLRTLAAGAVGTIRVGCLARCTLEPKCRYGEENCLDEGEHPVIGDIASSQKAFSDLAMHGIGGVKEIDFRVWVGRGHFASCQARDHRIHEVGTLRIAKAWKVELRKCEKFPLHIHAIVVRGG